MSRRPIGIDLFAGAGGMSLGFEQAGFDVVAAVEIDPVHCAVHKFNFPKTSVVAKSVVGLTASEIRLAAGIGSADIDCVFGGPPCQGFSMIGQRMLDDPRNSLVHEFVRLVAELKPKTFVFENVKGLTVGKQRAFLTELVAAFSSAGYDVRHPWKVLDATDFGVPQHRERLILFGARTGSASPDYPSAVEAKDRPTCRDALGDLPDADRFDELFSSDETSMAKFGKPSRYAAELRCLSNDAWHSGYVRAWDPSILTSSARTDHSDISRRRFGETAPGSVEPVSRFFKLDPDGLCNTLRAGTDSARGAFTSPRPIHYKFDRCVTVREMARLHGYPDWFRFHATKWHGARQIGNSVPPPLARAIAASVIGALGLRAPQSSPMPLTLGDPALLNFDISAAATYFGVPNPISRRDKKSGAKKRRQWEVEAGRPKKLAANG
jgi:DNA (cytosine-5)-methyltransferase 1